MAARLSVKNLLIVAACLLQDTLEKSQRFSFLVKRNRNKEKKKNLLFNEKALFSKCFFLQAPHPD